MKPAIALLTGLVSPEYEISKKSAENIVQQIDQSKFNLKVFDLSHQMNEFLSDYQKFDLAIPVVHGVGGEDGQLTAFCKTLGIPTLYSSHQGFAATIDKSIAGAILTQNGYKTPLTIHITTLEQLSTITLNKFFVKPTNGGSSIDNGVFTSHKQAEELVGRILSYDTVLVQEFVTGKELTVTVFDSKDGPTVAGITEIIKTSDYFDFEAKYNDPTTQEICPAQINQELETLLINQSIKIYRLFGLRTISRIDFLVNQSGAYCIDINSIPGFTSSSISPKALLHRGFDNLTDFWTEQINRALVVHSKIDFDRLEIAKYYKTAIQPKINRILGTI